MICKDAFDYEDAFWQTIITKDVLLLKELLKLHIIITNRSLAFLPVLNNHDSGNPED